MAGKDAEMANNITINVTINQGNREIQGKRNCAGAERERQPIDRANEALINNATTFNDLIRILRDRPEALRSAEFEAEERELEARKREMESGRMEDNAEACSDDEGINGSDGADDADDTDMLVKAKRRPSAKSLRLYEPRIAMREIGEDGMCEVFVNGYAVYDNGNRKTVVWVPDCGTATYYFGPLKDREREYLSQSDDIGEDVMGELPWYTPLLIAGEDSIERNLVHPKTAANSNDKSWEEEADVQAAKKWAGGYHFGTPEDIFLQKEERREALDALNDRQRDVFDRYCFEGEKQSDIAAEMGVTRQSVNETIQWAKKKIKKKMF